MTGQLVLLAGPAGAGKSTLAKAWCATRPVAAHVQLDGMRELIICGLVDPREESHPGQAEQWRTAVRATCALATSFAECGVDVAVDDALEPSAAPLWSPLLRGLPARLIVILPSLDTVLERGRSRAKYVPERIVRRQHQESRAWPAARTLDTTGWTVAESLAGLLQLLDRADSAWP